MHLLLAKLLNIQVAKLLPVLVHVKAEIRTELNELKAERPDLAEAISEVADVVFPALEDVLSGDTLKDTLEAGIEELKKDPGYNMQHGGLA